MRRTEIESEMRRRRGDEKALKEKGKRMNVIEKMQKKKRGREKKDVEE